MARRNFQINTRQQKEREITRYQDNFSGGVYNDIPASEVPDDGLYYTENIANKGSYLEGRTGTERWGFDVAPSTITGLNVSWTISGSDKTVVDDGATGSFLETMVGDYMFFDYSEPERIQTYIDTNTVVTYTEDTESGTDVAAIKGRLNLSYQHKGTTKTVCQFGTELYVSDIDGTGWEKCYNISHQKLSNNTSTIDEFENWVIIGNSNGIYRLNLDSDPLVYFKINTQVPNVKITSSGDESDTTPYGYKYNYTAVRMLGYGTVNRLTDGIVMETESGSNVTGENYEDYGAVWSANSTDASNPVLIGDLTVPVDAHDPTKSQQKHTHFGIYRTKDIGTNGKDAVTQVFNNPNLFIWVDDVPVAKAFSVNVTGTTVDSILGSFVEGDVGNTLVFNNGGSYESGVITAYVDSSTVTIASALTTDLTDVSAGFGPQYTDNVLDISQTAAVVTINYGRAFTSDDVGKTLFVAGGDMVTIIGFTDSTTITVSKEQTLINVGAVIDAHSRKYTDTLPDYDADPTVSQLSNNEAAFTLQSRFYKELPNCNEIKIVPGWLIGAQRNGKLAFYQDIPTGYEYLMGYYRPEGQYADFKDRILKIEEGTNKVIIFCASSTHDISTNSYTERANEAINDIYYVFTSQNVLDRNTGLFDFGSVVYSDEGYWICITNGPEFKRFDGYSYGDDLSSGRFNRLLEKLNPAISMSYDLINGVTFWGSDK